MSSRSFRRRNSRRRHRPPAATEAGGPPQSPGQPGERAPQEKEPSGARRGGPRRDSSASLQGKGAPGRSADHRPARPQPALPTPDCPICGKPVRELASAMTHRASRQPAHFDCIVRELRDSTEIAPQEKLCYLGAGSFGILEFRSPGGPSKFVIKKRIQYEEKELPQEWKKPLQISC